MRTDGLYKTNRFTDEYAGENILTAERSCIVRHPESAENTKRVAIYVVLAAVLKDADADKLNLLNVVVVIAFGVETELLD